MIPFRNRKLPHFHVRFRALSFFPSVLLLLATAAAASAQSVYLLRPEDPHAIYLGPGTFGALGDAVADDSAAIQAAIDRVADTTGEGVVFVAAGRYRITRTIHLWSGIRLIGYGAHRPVFLLAAATPGFQQGHEFLGTGRYMLQFASRRPASGAPVVDANEFTFYSGISNLDFEIASGNPAAIAIRFHVAQHSFLSHMNFNIGGARAALEDVGNNASDLHIIGGEFGIISVRTSPAWQFLLMDSSIEGQRRAAIHTQEVGMTLVRVRIAHTPIAVEISPGMTEQLYGRDLTLTAISDSAISLGDARKAHHQVTLDHILCDRVPIFVRAQPDLPSLITLRAPAPRYVEQHFSLGLGIGSDGREMGVVMRHHEVAAAVQPIPSDIPALPSMAEWANVRSLGAKGDGGTDDTVALQSAIDTHRVLYFPEGAYRVSTTLRLRPDSVLIGFSPVATTLLLWDHEAAFQGEGTPVPVVISARGGAAILSGIGIVTGDANPRASGLVWRAGPHSLVEDVNFPRGRGRLNATTLSPKLPPPLTSPSPDAFAGTEAPSLIVNDSGGGLFRGVWTANTNAASGLFVEDTVTPSIVYQMSCEHHMLHETQFHRASNWTVYALQTEEENPAGADSFSVELQNAHRFLFANLFMYRVSRNVKPKLNAVESTGSSDILFENVHNFSQTRLAFDNTLFDSNSGVHIRSQDFASFALTPGVHPGPPLPLPPVFATDAKLEQLATGFSNVSGLATSPEGTLFFTDAAMHGVYRWNASARKAEILTDRIPSPMAVGFVSPNSLLAIDYSRAVYSIDPVTGRTTKIDPVRTPRDGTSLLLPVGLHNTIETLRRQMERRGIVYAPRSNMAIVADVVDEPRDFFYAPGTTTAVMAGGNWQPMLQASQWAIIPIGTEHFAVSEEDDAIYRLTLPTLSSLTISEFAPRGGSSVVTDSAGNVYVADGQIYIYSPAGSQIGVLEVPERPSSLAIANGILYIGARSSLLDIRIRDTER
jgi:hypothetical protein